MEGPGLLWMHKQSVHNPLRAGFPIPRCTGLSDTCWNLWLMQKILIAFQTHPVGRKKSTNGEKYDPIWQALNCDWFMFCGATWPCPELQQKEICLAIRELLKMCLFLSTQVGKPLDSVQQVGMTQLPAELVTLPQYIQYVTQGLILLGWLTGIFLWHVAKSCPVNPLAASWYKLDLHYPQHMMRNGKFLT